MINERDSQYVWHPYTQHGHNDSILSVKKAKGAYLTLEDGRDILDGISSWWVNLHGHGHPKIVQAIAAQAESLEHVLFAGFTHEPAVRLSEVLIGAMAERKTKISKVFFSDNGSTAVEVALKMAFQYHLNTSGEERPRFLALHKSYHGDTFGAMAVGEPEGYHKIFRGLIPRVDFVNPGDINELEKTLEQNHKEYSCFILEPLIQGAGGMNFYSIEYLKRVSELCRQYNILLVCDEVFTGFYRTGLAFAFEHAEIAPDLICISKGITGGFLPLAATLTTQKIFDAFLSKEVSKAFLHGHSYTANPIACAAALASWDLLMSDSTQKNIQQISETTKKALETLSQNKSAFDTRSLGTVGAVTMNFDFNYMSDAGRWFKTRALEKGVLLRTLGHVLYSVPPYCVTSDEVTCIYKTIDELMTEFRESKL